MEPCKMLWGRPLLPWQWHLAWARRSSRLPACLCHYQCIWLRGKTRLGNDLLIEVDRISVSVSAPNVDRWALSADIRFRPRAVVPHWCTFCFGMMQLVNSVVAKSRVQSLSCGGRECARRRESLASLCTDWLCKDNRGSWLSCPRLHLVLWALTGWH